MSVSPFFSGRIPQDLFDHIDQRIKETGESKTEVLIHALAAYTGFDLLDVKEGQQSLLMQKVESLSLEIKAMKEQIEDIKSLQNQQKQASIKIEEVDANTKEKSQETEIDRQIASSLPLFPDSITDNIAENKNDNKDVTDVQILSTKEATKLLGIGSNSTIPDWYKKGKLPKTINGKTLEFDRKEKEKGYFWKITTKSDG